MSIKAGRYFVGIENYDHMLELIAHVSEGTCGSRGYSQPLLLTSVI